VYGGQYKDFIDLLAELWMVPPGAELRKVKEYRTDLDRIKGKVAEYSRYDGPSDCAGACAASVTLSGVADALKEQPESVVYIVAANQIGATIGTWRRVARSEASSLETLGIASDRIKIIF